MHLALYARLRPFLVNSPTHFRLASQFSKFTLIGGLATAVQYAILVILTKYWGWDPVLASTVGYVCGATLNYYLNHRLTFRSVEKHFLAVPRFALVASIGLSLNAVIMTVAIRSMGLPYLLSQVVTTAIVLFWNFNANRTWTYRARKKPLYLTDQSCREKSLSEVAPIDKDFLKECSTSVSNVRPSLPARAP